MPSFLHHFFHNETNGNSEQGLAKIPKNIEDWPDEWKNIEYKKYHLFQPVPLPPTGTSLFNELLAKRRSSEGYISENQMTLSALAHILYCGYGLQGISENENRTKNRTVPSAGQRYPLEIYPILFKSIDTCGVGVYHYGVKDHILEPIVLDTFSKEEIFSFAPFKWLMEANGMICISGVFNRAIDKYGSRGYRYILLEAGHVAQNMLLAATENQLNIVPVGGTNEETIEKRIGLTVSNERIVYTLFF